MLLLLSADTFENRLFQKKNFKNTIRVSNGLGPDHDRHSVLIWVLTVCKIYQETTKVVASKQRVKFYSI